MKDFNNFLSTITTKEVEDIMNEADRNIESLRSDNSDQSTHLGNQIGGLSFSISLQLLRRYHEWLEQQDHF
ncbi:hypothetical protein I6G25_05500 [Macrococcoides caseolyticum]|uniref:hypothetical protein n=1 Tax=Macrococcoides caseolyticum TaxID=69966 RepID=UPI0014735FF7|nr:hypothetical protein [Macrococcus caseolyticus]QPT45694.1 hypothetical protein I6G25_05500 [Macrococcus caseolyticus]